MPLTQGQSSAYGYTSSNSAQTGYTNGTAATLASNAQAAAANANAYNNWLKAAEFNAAEAQKQREWQERMASTAYQRTMADMKKAGLNPILAAQNGATAVGGGAAATMGTSNSYMANAFADSYNSGHTTSYGENFMNSDNGILTLIDGLKSLAEGIYDNYTSGGIVSDGIEAAEAMAEDIAEKVTDLFNKGGSKTHWTWKGHEHGGSGRKF